MDNDGTNKDKNQVKEEEKPQTSPAKGLNNSEDQMMVAELKMEQPNPDEAGWQSEEELDIDDMDKITNTEEIKQPTKEKQSEMNDKKSSKSSHMSQQSDTIQIDD